VRGSHCSVLAAILVPPLFALLTGCAARQTSSPFIIKKGSGPVNVGDAGRVAKVKRADLDRASRQAILERAGRAREVLRSIEALDPQLRDALAALASDPTAPAHVRVGQEYWRLKVYDAAYDYFSDALRLNPKSVGAWEGRARVWRDWRLTGPALSDVSRARFYGPDRPEVLNTLGTILEQAGQWSAAKDAYVSALKLDPSASWARDNLQRLQGRTDD